jgi:hypothetical protein
MYKMYIFETMSSTEENVSLTGLENLEISIRYYNTLLYTWYVNLQQVMKVDLIHFNFTISIHLPILG